MPPISSARLWVMRVRWPVSNKPTDLFWIILLADRLPEPLQWTVDNLFPIHRATIDEPWRLRGFGGGPTYRCALCVALLLNQKASERKKTKKKHFDTVNEPINVGAKEPAHKTYAIFLRC